MPSLSDIITVRCKVQNFESRSGDYGRIVIVDTDAWGMKSELLVKKADKMWESFVSQKGPTRYIS